MTAINITAVNVLDNPTLFINPFQFEIQYECLQDLQHGEGYRCHQNSLKFQDALQWLPCLLHCLCDQPAQPTSFHRRHVAPTAMPCAYPCQCEADAL